MGARAQQGAAGLVALGVRDAVRTGLQQRDALDVRGLREQVDGAHALELVAGLDQLAPNAAQLVEAGYELNRVRPVDLFPQTPHIECVALLEAGSGGVANPERDA